MGEDKESNQEMRFVTCEFSGWYDARWRQCGCGTASNGQVALGPRPGADSFTKRLVGTNWSPGLRPGDVSTMLWTRDLLACLVHLVLLIGIVQTMVIVTGIAAVIAAVTAAMTVTVTMRVTVQI